MSHTVRDLILMNRKQKKQDPHVMLSRLICFFVLDLSVFCVLRTQIVLYQGRVFFYHFL